MSENQVKPISKILANAQLPALPQSAVHLLKLSQDPNNGPNEFAVPIEADPGLTGQVLKFVNSSYFGFVREISSVKTAITLVGIRTIKNFSLWSAVFSLMPNPKNGSLDLRALWQDSLRRAIFARNLGRVLGLKDVEEIFATALLQDMAIPILAKELPADYAKLLEARKQNGCLSVLEKEHFGWTHAEAAGYLARQWSLPDRFALLVENHNHLPEQLSADISQSAVSLSSCLPSVTDSEWFDADRFMTTFERLAGTDASLTELMQKVDSDYAEFAPLLKMGTPAQSLTERINDLVMQTGHR